MSVVSFALAVVYIISLSRIT